MGLVLGVVVIVVAAAIVITIVALAARIAKQAGTAEEAVAVVRGQTDALDGIGAHQRLGRARPARGPRAAQGGGRQVSANDYWTLSLAIGAVAALCGGPARAAAAAARPASAARSAGLLDVAGKVGANTANIPQLEATAPVLALIVDEAVVQDGYMNALTDGYGTSHEPGHADRAERACSPSW